MRPSFLPRENVLLSNSPGWRVRTRSDQILGQCVRVCVYVCACAPDTPLSRNTMKVCCFARQKRFREQIFRFITTPTEPLGILETSNQLGVELLLVRGSGMSVLGDFGGMTQGSVFMHAAMVSLCRSVQVFRLCASSPKSVTQMSLVIGSQSKFGCLCHHSARQCGGTVYGMEISAQDH